MIDPTQKLGVALIQPLPHVFVGGDLAELQLVAWHNRLPDHSDNLLAPYRKLRGFTRRVTAGGAWSVATFVRAALRDVWRTSLDIPLTSNSLNITAPFSHAEKMAWWVDAEGPAKGLAHSGQQGIHPSLKLLCDKSGPNLKQPKLPIAKKGLVTAIQGTTYTDEDIDRSSRVYDFSGGVVKVVLKGMKAGLPIGLVSSIFKGVQWAKWTRPVVISPCRNEINIAVRFLPDNHVFSDKSMMRRLSPWMKIKQRLGRNWDPLDTFLQIEKSVATSSAAVLVLCRSWEKLSPRDAVGYFVYWETTQNRSWQMWTSHSSIGLRRPLVSDWSQESNPSLSRREWEHKHLAMHVGATRGISDFRTDKNGHVVVIPLSGEMARLIQPSIRPVAMIHPPEAFVSTVHGPHPELRPDLNSPPEVIRPIWDITLGSTDKNVFRLKTPDGYAFPEDWYQSTRQMFDLWTRENANTLSPHVAFDTEEQELARCLEWGLSRYHRHQLFLPEWAPKVGDPKVGFGKNAYPGIKREFQHLVFTDLNFGYRRHPEHEPSHSGTGQLLKITDQFVQVMKGETLPASQVKGEAPPVPPKISRPDWWHPLLKWVNWPASSQKGTEQAKLSSLQDRGWIVAILGRQLPLRELISCEDCDAWDDADLWHLLRRTEINQPEVGAKSGTKGKSIPIFRDRTVVILSGHLLRASGAKISYRLSWEHTALDCIRELESNPRFQPLLEFRHLVVRFGCVGAVHISRRVNADGKREDSNALFYDATAADGYFRNPERDGRVIGSNSVFSARILQALIERKVVRSEDSDSAVKDGIRQAILDCQSLYAAGYGTSFKDSDPYQMDLSTPFDVLFNSKPVFKPGK
jgi:hypothetical protein